MPTGLDSLNDEITRGLHINRGYRVAQRARLAWRRRHVQVGNKYSNSNKRPTGGLIREPANRLNFCRFANKPACIPRCYCATNLQPTLYILSIFFPPALTSITHPRGSHVCDSCMEQSGKHISLISSVRHGMTK